MIHSRPLEHGSVVYEAIDTAETLHRRLGHMTRGLHLRHAGGHGQGIMAGFGEVGGGRLGALSVNIGHNHPGPRAG